MKNNLMIFSVKTAACSNQQIFLGITMKTLFVIIVSLVCSLALVPAHAVDLNSAKQAGHIGETDGGYIAAVGSVDADTQALIDNVNSKRKQHYQKLANQNNVSLSSIEELAGQKAIAKTAAGHMVQIDGNWSKK